MASVRHDELAAQRRPVVGVEQNHTAVRTPGAAGDFMLHDQEIQQVLCGNDCGRANVYEAALDPPQIRVCPELLRVAHHVSPAESPGDDGTQQSGDGLDGERDRHGQQR